MRYLKYAALAGLLVVFAGAMASTASAQVRVGVGIGIGPAYGPAPVCAYGYYPDYPYACAPVGYYGPEWFVNGVFIGAGPWFHGFHRGPVFVGRPFVGHRFVDRGFVGPRFVERGRDFDGRGRVEIGHGRGGFVGRGSAGFHGGGFHGGRGHGGGSHGGGHR